MSGSQEHLINKDVLWHIDSIADAGYLTISLDYFTGDPVYLHRGQKVDGCYD
jgi:hypothetical protein